MILKTISYKEWFLPWRHRYWTPWDAFGFIHLIQGFVREAHSKLWWITFKIFCCISNSRMNLGIRIVGTHAGFITPNLNSINSFFLSFFIFWSRPNKNFLLSNLLFDSFRIKRISQILNQPLLRLTKDVSILGFVSYVEPILFGLNVWISIIIGFFLFNTSSRKFD